MKLKDQVAKIHDDINQAMENIAQKYNLHFIPGTARYNDDEVRVRVILQNDKAHEIKWSPYVPTGNCSFEKGDKVKIGFQKRSALYEIVDFKRKNVVIRNVDSGTRYRIDPKDLVKA